LGKLKNYRIGMGKTKLDMQTKYKKMQIYKKNVNKEEN